MTQPHTELTGKALARLVRNEKAQRNKTRKMTYKGRPLKVEPVSVLGLWLLQAGKCGCGCGAPLDPDAAHPDPESIVFAHRLLRARGGGHTTKNGELWRKLCNDREAASEKVSMGVGNRTGFSEERKQAPKADKPKSKWASRGFQTNKGGKYKQTIGGRTELR